MSFGFLVTFHTQGQFNLAKPVHLPVCFFDSRRKLIQTQEEHVKLHTYSFSTNREQVLLWFTHQSVNRLEHFDQKAGG